MPAMTPVANDDPLLLAWNRYKDTDDYANTARWALVPEHTEGSLWAAFAAGYLSYRDAKPPPEPPKET